MGSVHHKMCSFAIKRVTRSVQLLQSRQRVGHLEQGAISVVTSSLVQKRRRYIEIDHPTGVMQAPAIFGVQDNATAGRQHNILLAGEFRDRLRFTPPEPILSFDLENRWNRHSSARYDFVVGIVKSPPQTLRQLTPHGSFAGPHQAD